MDLVILLPAKSNCKRQQNTSFSAWHKLKQWHGIWCPQCAWVQVVLEPIKRLCNKKWIIHAVLETSPFVRHIEYKNVCQLQIDSSVERECIIFHTNSRYVIHDTLSCNGKHFFTTQHLRHFFVHSILKAFPLHKKHLCRACRLH